MNLGLAEETSRTLYGGVYESFIGSKEPLEDRLVLVISGEQLGVVVE